MSTQVAAEPAGKKGNFPLPHSQILENLSSSYLVIELSSHSVCLPHSQSSLVMFLCLLVPYHRELYFLHGNDLLFGLDY